MYRTLISIMLVFLLQLPVLADNECIDNLAECKQKAVKYFQDGKYQDSKKIWEEIQTHAIKISNIKLKAECLKGLGNIQKEQKDYSQAIKLYEEAKQLASNYKCKKCSILEADCTYNICDTLLRQNIDEYENISCIEKLRKLAAFYNSQKDYLGEIQCYDRIGSYYLETADYNNAEKAYLTANQLLKKEENNNSGFEFYRMLIINTYNKLFCKYKKNQSDLNLRLIADELLSLKKEIEITENDYPLFTVKSKLLNVLGRIYFDLGNYYEAKKYFNDSNDLTSDDETKIDNEIGLSEIALNESDFDKAKSLLNKLISKFDKIEDKNITTEKLKSALLGTVGNYYYVKKDYNKAFESYLEALDIQNKYVLVEYI
ncbi:MAG: hypothetical protein AB1782_03400, partial [Cyanobacteriota bacterium]